MLQIVMRLKKRSNEAKTEALQRFNRKRELLKKKRQQTRLVIQAQAQPQDDGQVQAQQPRIMDALPQMAQMRRAEHLKTPGKLHAYHPTIVAMDPAMRGADRTALMKTWKVLRGRHNCSRFSHRVFSEVMTAEPAAFNLLDRDQMLPAHVFYLSRFLDDIINALHSTYRSRRPIITPEQIVIRHARLFFTGSMDERLWLTFTHVFSAVLFEQNMIVLQNNPHTEKSWRLLVDTLSGQLMHTVKTCSIRSPVDYGSAEALVRALNNHNHAVRVNAKHAMHAAQRQTSDTGSAGSKRAHKLGIPANQRARNTQFSASNAKRLHKVSQAYKGNISPMFGYPAKKLGEGEYDTSSLPASSSQDDTLSNGTTTHMHGQRQQQRHGTSYRARQSRSCDPCLQQGTMAPRQTLAGWAGYSNQFRPKTLAWCAAGSSSGGRSGFRKQQQPTPDYGSIPDFSDSGRPDQQQERQRLLRTEWMRHYLRGGRPAKTGSSRGRPGNNNNNNEFNWQQAMQSPPRPPLPKIVSMNSLLS